MPGEPFQPVHMFFYRSLMDPEVPQAILDLPESPTTKPATISGFHIKMWGIYPTLIPSHSGSEAGTVWKVASEATSIVWQLTRLPRKDGTSAMLFWKGGGGGFSGIAVLFAGQGSLRVRSLKTGVSIWNAIRNTSKLLSLDVGRRYRDSLDNKLGSKKKKEHEVEEKVRLLSV